MSGDSDYVSAGTDGLGFRGAQRQSMFKANIFAVECALITSCYLAALYTPDLIWVGLPAPSAGPRCTLLACFGVAYMMRLNVMARWLLPRELATEELTVVPLWIAGIMSSICLGALPLEQPTSAKIAICSSVFFCLGSWFNTWSELQRKWWKAMPENRGRCYTQGLFSLSCNINYFGDVMLFGAWAGVPERWWNIWIPLTMAASFYFHHIPDKEKYLRERYAKDWPAYDERTKSFIPFLC